jgi:hypothetical protein
MLRLAPLGLVLVLAGGCSTVDVRARTERQLAELYRPLLALVKESRASVEDFLKNTLKREYIFPPDGKWPPEELKLWLAKAEGDLMPRNDRMCALVRGKRDLVDGTDLPPAWKVLLEHQDGWNAAHRRWKEQGVKYPWHAPSPFPKNLERALEMDIERLEKRLAEAAK